MVTDERKALENVVEYLRNERKDLVNEIDSIYTVDTASWSDKELFDFAKQCDEDFLNKHIWLDVYRLSNYLRNTLYF